MSEKKKRFYGWNVAIAGAFIMAVSMGIVVESFAQFIKPVCMDMGFTRQQMSLTLTISSVIQVFMGLIWGTVLKKVNLHKMMCVSAVLTPALYFCYSFAQNIQTFWIITVPLGFIYSFLAIIPISYVVGNWFLKDKGVAIGLSTMGCDMGAMVMNFVIGHLIIHFGWRMGFKITAIIMFLVAAPCVFFVIKEKPSDMGLVPLGYEKKDDEKDKVPEMGGVPFAQAIRTPLFWIMVISTLCLVFCVNSLFMLITPHLSDQGYPMSFAVIMASIGMGEMSMGTIVTGKIFDKFGAQKANLLCNGSLILGLIGLVFAKSYLGIVGILIGILLGTSFGFVGMPVMIISVFGLKDYGAIWGKITAAAAMGSALVPVISGKVYDMNGSYNPLFITCIGIALLCMICLAAMLPKGKTCANK